MPKKPAASRPKTPVQLRAERRFEWLKHELRREIRSRGLVELDLARELGLGKSLFSDLFAEARGGKSVALRVDTLLALLDLLGLEPAEFFRRVQRGWKALEDGVSTRSAATKAPRSRPATAATELAFLEGLGAGGGVPRSELEETAASVEKSLREVSAGRRRARAELSASAAGARPRARRSSGRRRAPLSPSTEPD